MVETGITIEPPRQVLQKMQPVAILKKGIMPKKDIAALRKNGLCVVECDDPDAVRFIEPPLPMLGYDRIEQAAIALTRKLLKLDNTAYVQGQDIAVMFVRILVEGTRLAPPPAPPAVPEPQRGRPRKNP